MRSNVRFTLVRPRNPNNIAACARAIANFGFDELAAVDPYPPIWKEAKAAVGAEDVLERAQAVTLDAALSDGCVILGTQDGPSKAGPPTIDLPILADWLSTRLPQRGKLVVLFGSEKTGLSNQELERCHAVVRIPTDEKCSSMNLSQAVAVVAYELSRRSSRAREKKIEAMTDAHRERFVRQGVLLCRTLGYGGGQADRKIADNFRRLLLRRPLSKTEAAVLSPLLLRMLTKTDSRAKL